MKTVVSAGMALSVAAAMLAASSSTSVSAEAGPNVSTAVSAGSLGDAMSLPEGVTVKPALVGDSRSFGVATGAFDDFPRAGSTYAVLSTGLATDLFSMRRPTTDFGDDGLPDSTSLTLQTTSATTDRCLLIDLAMGTEERVHTYASGASDGISIVADGVEYAMNPGPRYFAQKISDNEVLDMAPVRYTVNSIDYWHAIPGTADTQPDDETKPLLAEVSGFDNVTSVETIHIPVRAHSAPDVAISIADANNGDLDSVALVDNVRFAAKCPNDPTARTGLYPRENAQIVGHRGVGRALTVDLVPSTPAIERYDSSDNGWEPKGQVDLRFRWYRSDRSCTSGNMNNWLPIADADRQSYTPTIADKDECLLVLVSGRKDGYWTETYPAPGKAGWVSTLPIQDGVFTNLQLPTIEMSRSTIKFGDVLTAKVGTFFPTPDSYGFDWYADGDRISGESGQTFTVTPAQAGKKIRVRVTAARRNFVSMAINSLETGAVESLYFTSGRATITGVAKVGSSLTAGYGGWAPVEPRSRDFRWLIDGEVVGKSASLTVPPTAVGKRIVLQLTGRRDGYIDYTTSTSSAVVAPGTLTSAVPSIGGTPRPGKTLRVSRGSWKPSGLTYRYQWYIGTKAIKGATGTSYRVPKKYRNKKIRVRVVGSKLGYATVIRYSAYKKIAKK